MTRRKKLTDADWSAVFALRCRSKRGEALAPEARAVLDRAWKEDPERYASLEPDVFRRDGALWLRRTLEALTGQQDSGVRTLTLTNRVVQTSVDHTKNCPGWPDCPTAWRCTSCHDVYGACVTSCPCRS